MRKRRGFFCIAIWIGIALATGPAPAGAAEARHPVMGLGSFIPTGLNDPGQAVGYVDDAGLPGGRRALLWLPVPAYGLPAGVNDLGSMLVPGADFRGPAPVDINNLGQIAGSAGVGGYGEKALLWLPSPAYGRPRGWSVIDASSGWDRNAVALNDAGQITGHLHSLEAAYAWLPDPADGRAAGTFSVPMPRYGWGFGHDINDAGQVVGRNYELDLGSIDDGRSVAFAYYPRAAYGHGAGTFYLPLPGEVHSQAVAINDRGHIVGTVGGVDSRTFLWLPEPDSVTGRDAGLHFVIPEGSIFQPTDINDAGFVIGIGRVGNSPRAMLWDPNTGQLADLNELVDPSSGWELRYAIAMNDAGQILGVGRLNGIEQAFLLTVPEPSGLMVLLAAPALLLRRRK